tara:strand:+ start:228 stop:611 length:384 start_codon:yes stop_codon:yes gene_type:complete
MPNKNKVTQKIPDKLFFKIGEVSKLAATKPHVLRYWEKEFPVLKPTKSDTGQRVYRKKDVELIMEIRRLLYDENFTISGAKKQFKRKYTRTKKNVAQKDIVEVQSATDLDIALLRNELEEILKLLKN